MVKGAIAFLCATQSFRVESAVERVLTRRTGLENCRLLAADHRLPCLPLTIKGIGGGLCYCQDSTRQPICNNKCRGLVRDLDTSL